MNFGQAFDQLRAREVCIRRVIWRDTAVIGIDAEMGLVWGDNTTGTLVKEPVQGLTTGDLMADDWEVVS